MIHVDLYALAYSESLHIHEMKGEGGGGLCEGPSLNFLRYARVQSFGQPTVCAHEDVRRDFKCTRYALPLMFELNAFYNLYTKCSFLEYNYVTRCTWQ